MNPILNSQYEQLADGLALKGYAVIDDFLSKEEVNDILLSDEFRNELLPFRKAGMGREKQVDAEIRGDYIQWIDRENPTEDLKGFIEKLNGLIPFLNQALFLSLKDFEVHKTIYPAGSHYHRHLDQLEADNHRRLSIVCYLNNAWQEEHGGKLRMFLPDGTKDILPVAGRLVCFRSDQIEHEVLPATRNRLSLTGWMLDQFSALKHL